ncbi:hypothetical protein [Arthrobacter livingstonensis]|uniref:hypothetical protein n=1 Tax=Arthrobacter livingstonensis TaxID=670078 RepID=UPI001FE4F709|nr:hypothetical protein [Arthrobacter livingstonensis]
MAGWNTSEDPPSASAISPTMSPDHCSNLADSDRNYTLNSEEPLYHVSGNVKFEQLSFLAIERTAKLKNNPVVEASIAVVATLISASSSMRSGHMVVKTTVA